jgi:hypothetical protein
MTSLGSSVGQPKYEIREFADSRACVCTHRFAFVQKIQHEGYNGPESCLWQEEKLYNRSMPSFDNAQINNPTSKFCDSGAH